MNVLCNWQLALKHRQNKNHKTRIILFVGSPLDADESTLVKVAKKLKKEKVNVDIVSFGEDEVVCNYTVHHPLSCYVLMGSSG